MRDGVRVSHAGLDHRRVKSAPNRLAAVVTGHADPVDVPVAQGGASASLASKRLDPPAVLLGRTRTPVGAERTRQPPFLGGEPACGGRLVGLLVERCCDGRRAALLRHASYHNRPSAIADPHLDNVVSANVLGWLHPIAVHAHAAADHRLVDDVVMVPEVDTVRTRRQLARRGFLFGGSTGTVVSGALEWLSQKDTGDLTTVAISPDLGEHYLETVYTDEWVEEHYGNDVLVHDEPQPEPDHVDVPLPIGPPAGVSTPAR